MDTPHSSYSSVIVLNNKTACCGCECEHYNLATHKKQSSEPN